MKIVSVPFKRFIIAFLVLGESIPVIQNKLKDFGMHIDENEAEKILIELRNILPDSLKEKLNSNIKFDDSIDIEKQWMQQLGVYEFCDFALRRKDPDSKKEYFKWFNDCLWLVGAKDTMSLVNIFMFNKEEYESISAIISFKYRKKIGVESLKRYHDIFWDTDSMNAKEALYFCPIFQKSTLIIRDMRAAGIVIEKYESSDDGEDINSLFHDSNYIKWKIGFKEVEIPGPTDFLEGVMKDSYFKYYESMNMLRSVEEESESGSNDKLGDFESRKVKRRNVEEQRIKMAKGWLEMYSKAHKYKKASAGTSTDEDFFEKMKNLELKFDEEKLMDIEASPEVYNDIKEDI